MALKNCKECGKEVSTKAEKCPNCGVPIKRKRVGCLGAIILIICFFVFIGVIGSLLSTGHQSSSSSSPPKDAVNFSEIEKAVIDLSQSGVIYKLNPELNEVYVLKALWDTTTVDQKNTMGYVFGHYCGYKKGTNLYWVDIKDNKTGKRLAKWSKSWGMQIEN